MHYLLDPTNHLFALARRGKRVTHIVLVVVLAIVFLFASQIIGGLVGVLLVPFLPISALQARPAGVGLLTAISLIAAFGPLYLILWAWVRLFEGRSFASLGLERHGALPKWLGGALLGFVAFAATIGIAAAFGWIGGEAGDPQLQGIVALGGVLLALIGWLVQGAAEEVLTRGWVLQAIGARYRPCLGVLVSTLLFAGLHGLNANIAALPLLNLALFGVFTALWALREGGLWGVCGFHAIWNWVQGNVFGLQVSGNDSRSNMLLNLRETGPDIVTGGAFGPEGGLACTAVLLVSIVLVALWGRAAPRVIQTTPAPASDIQNV